LFSFGTKREPEKCQRFRRAGPTRKGLLAPFNPKEDGLHTKKLAASLNAFLCSAISRPLSRCGGSSPQGSGCALSVTFGDTLSPFLSLRDIFPRPGEVFQRERQEALPLRPWLPFKRKARSVPSTLLALPPGELANPKGLTERAKGSPFGRAGAKRLRGFASRRAAGSPLARRSRREPAAADTVRRYGPSREKVNPKQPQLFRIYKYKNNISADIVRAKRRQF